MDHLRHVNNTKINEKLAKVEEMQISDQEKTYRKERIYTMYDFDTSINPYKDITISKLKKDTNGEHEQTFIDNYYTDFGKFLINPVNKDVRSIYNSFIKINEEAALSGFIPFNQVYNFIPNIHKGMIEQGAKSIKGVWKSFTDKFRIIPDAGLYGKLDPATNLPIKEVFCPYTSDFFNGEYSQKSLDLGVVYTEFFKGLQQAKMAKELEPFAESLRSLEERKKVIETTDAGLAKKIFKGLGFLKTNEKANLEYLDMMIDVGIYGRGIQDSFDKLITTDEGNTYSLRKGLNNTIQYMYMNTFGLNPFTAIRNMMGGLFSSVFTSGRHFATTDIASIDTFWKAATTTTGKMDEQSTLIAAILGNYLPIINNQFNRKITNLSMNELTKWVNPDFIMALQNKSENVVQISVAVALLKNTLLLNNKLVNVNEYVKELYPDKYNGINNPKEIDILRNNKKKELLLTSSILTLAKVKDGKLEIPSISEEEISKFVNLAQYYQSKATGQNPEWNTIGYKTLSLGRLAGMYKNWIPRTVQARLGNFKYNSQLDGYEWGRWLNFANAVSSTTKQGFMKGVSTLFGFGNKELLIEHAKESYLNFIKESREKKTNFQKFLSEEQFIEEYINNVQNTVKEMYVMTFMTILLASTLLDGDDDDSKEERAAKSFAKFQLDRLKDEFTFYINPSSFSSIAGSPFPIISFFNNVLKIPMWELPKQLLGFTGDSAGFEFGEKWMEEAHPLKYVLKSVPVFSELSKYLTFLYPDLAKDLGIRPITIRNL
jgi:hypothetical protein